MSSPTDPRDPRRRRTGAGGGPGGPGDFPGFPGFPGIPEDFFADFEKEFQRMRGMMQKIMEDAMKHASGPQRNEPFVYGFSMRVGPDGMPQIQPFGNTTPPVTMTGAPAVDEGREPLTDVFEGEKEITVTAEMPGVEKGDISLHVAERAVTLRVEKGRRYHKVIQLPAKVVPSSAKATYKNGVLDITLQRTDDSPGHKVSIQ